MGKIQDRNVLFVKNSLLGTYKKYQEYNLTNLRTFDLQQLRGCFSLTIYLTRVHALSKLRMCDVVAIVLFEQNTKRT